MERYDLAINEAKKILNRLNRDKAHDLFHHEAVWKNCLEIIHAENPRVDSNLLKVATFWHDVVLDEVKWPSRLNLEETCVYLDALLKKHDFTSTEVQTIIETVKHHEFRDTPTTIEGLVLQDADKLETVSIDRWNRTLEDFKNGNLAKETLVSYLKTFLKWSPILGATFHYNFSRERALREISPLWTDKKWEKVFADFNLENEYEAAKKAKDSLKVKLLRLLIRMKNVSIALTLDLKHLSPW
jgi:hypothetical protein